MPFCIHLFYFISWEKLSTCLGHCEFCVIAGMMALHDHGIFGQFLIKKTRYWPKDIPSDFINGEVSSKGLVETSTYVQNLNNVHFLVQCCSESCHCMGILKRTRILIQPGGWLMVSGKVSNMLTLFHNITRLSIGLSLLKNFAMS